MRSWGAAATPAEMRSTFSPGCDQGGSCRTTAADRRTEVSDPVALRFMHSRPSQPVAGDHSPAAHDRSPFARHLRHVAVAWVGAFVVIGVTWKMFDLQRMLFAFASLGGSSVIVFGMPDGKMAQPRSLFGGHAVGAVTGLVFLALFGHGTLALAAATATALALMMLTDTIHSPAGADPIIVMLGGVSAGTATVELALGLAFLWALGVLLLNAFRVHPYGPWPRRG